jgi:hypothetical protein
MALTATRPSTDGGPPAGSRNQKTPGRRAGRRHKVPLVVVGVLLVVGCALGFADASLSLAGHEDVLVVAQPLAAGEILQAADLRAVRVSTGAGIQVVPVGSEQSVVGRPVALALVAGALLTPGELGSGAAVGAGADVVAVALKAGLFPPALAPGDRVQVVPVVTASSSTQTAPGGPVDAVVVGVQAAAVASGGPTVFSLQVQKSEADGVASLAAAGEVSLVQLGARS